MKLIVVAATLKAGKSVKGGLTFLELEELLPVESLFTSIFK